MFVHLDCHTEYSISNGIVRIQALCDMLAKHKMPAVAITDDMNLFAAVKFYTAALAKGIKPIIGATIHYCDEERPNEVFKTVVLCRNIDGYRDLSELISQAYLHPLDGRPIIRRSWMVEKLTNIIVILQHASDVGHYLMADAKVEVDARIAFWKEQAKQQVYVAITRIGEDHEERYIQKIFAKSQECHLPIVATNGVRFLHESEYEAHEARVCICAGTLLSQTQRKRMYTSAQYLRNPQEMRELFQDIPQVIDNALEIAKRCNCFLPIGKSILPDFSIDEPIGIDAYLKKLSSTGLEKRLQTLKPVDATTYWDRLEQELKVIENMGYAGYFLIVADFIQWAKSNHVPVGPGRGSGAGSLVAYALGITDLDPLAYDLLFERFLNPERVSMPDFDIDFCMEKRDKVIHYVTQKYGAENVAQIITFGTMAARAVVRDVGRVLGMPYGYVDRVAKLIPNELGITLTKALKDEPELKSLYKSDDEVHKLIDLSMQLEGLTRNASRHAGGVVIAPKPITHYAPVYIDEDSPFPVTQFDKDDIETVGLIKFDFLGLKTLTVIQKAIDIVNRAHPDQNAIDIMKIPLDDEKTFELLQQGKTTAVFQLESFGLKKLILRLKPDCFEDIVALVALYRPGPLQSGMVDDFIHRKHGISKASYLHPDMEAILSSTYGVILYQEQVMQIAQSIGGYSLGGADLLRRAMGKKKPKEMAKHRKIFVKGAIKSGMSEADATTVFDLMEKFAAYGFNKSHSAAYALLSYQTAWLKAHYPAAFMAAVLSTEMDNTDKVVMLVQDCKIMDIELIPPDIRQCKYHFSMVDHGTIAYGLGAIKGAGQSAIEFIVELCKRQTFENFSQFVMALDLKKFNRRALEALIHAGAMDYFGQTRQTLLASLDALLLGTEQHQKNLQTGQSDLFQAERSEIALTIKPEMPYLEKLKHEKQVLGWYVSGHPMIFYEQEMKALGCLPLEGLEKRQNTSLKFSGVIRQMRKLFTRSGDIFLLTLEDTTASQEVSIFGEAFREFKVPIQKDMVVWCEGIVSEEQDRIRVRISQMHAMEAYRAEHLSSIHIKCANISLNAKQIARTLKAHTPGQVPVELTCYTDNVSGTLLLGEDWRVEPTDGLIYELSQIFGEDNVQLKYRKSP